MSKNILIGKNKGVGIEHSVLNVWRVNYIPSIVSVSLDKPAS